MNKLESKDLQELFWFGETDLKLFSSHPYRTEAGIVLYCIEGEARVSIGILEHDIIKSTEITILPQSTLRFLYVSKDFKAKVFSFSKDLYDEASIRLNFSFSTLLRQNTCTYVHGEDIYHKNLHTLMDMAQLVYQEENNEFHIIIKRNFVQTYILYLYDKCHHRFEEIAKKYTRKQEIFHQFLTLIDSYCLEQRDIGFYAHKLSITPRYLAMVTKESSSYDTPKEIIDKRFLQEVQYLLKFSEMSIKQIANKLNFPDQSYFSRYFKHHTGMTASKYRTKLPNI